MNKNTKIGLIALLCLILMAAYGYYMFKVMIRPDLEQKKRHVEEPFS